MGLPLSRATFVVVDVETTGLSPAEGGITEIAMIKVRDGMIFDEYHTLVNPGVAIPYNITALTGIDDLMVANAPTAAEVAPAISEFIGDAIFTAHNAPFDLGFVNSTLMKGGFEPLSNTVLCTCKLARRLLPALPSKSLGPVARQLGVRNNHRHRAAGDAYATVEVLVKFLERLERDFEVTDLEGVLRFQ